MTQAQLDLLCSADYHLVEDRERIPERYFHTVWEIQDFQAYEERRKKIKEEGMKRISTIFLDLDAKFKDFKLDSRRII